MRLKWTHEAELEDLPRLYEFLAKVNPRAAGDAIRSLVAAPELLLMQPKMGEPLLGYAPREVRRWFLKNYEIRYELQDDTLIVLRVWHTREDRSTD